MKMTSAERKVWEKRASTGMVLEKNEHGMICILWSDCPEPVWYHYTDPMFESFEKIDARSNPPEAKS
jgi:hypothetical protein